MFQYLATKMLQASDRLPTRREKHIAAQRRLEDFSKLLMAKCESQSDPDEYKRLLASFRDAFILQSNSNEKQIEFNKIRVKDAPLRSLESRKCTSGTLVDNFILYKCKN